MKNKIYLFFAVLLIMAQVSCKKELTKINSKKDRLTSVTWKYQHYYMDFNQSNTILAYFIHKGNNLRDLSKNRIKYNSDGTYTETDETGKVTSGTWKFNADETNIESFYNEVVTVKKIFVLDETGFQWGSLDGDTVAIMIRE